MGKIRVADYITNYLYTTCGVEHIFMLSGGGSIYLDDSIASHSNVNGVCVRNEATAGMMANGYVKSGAKLGVAYVTTGPGSINALSGLAEAWVDSCPILIVSGQVSSSESMKNKSASLRTYGTQEIDILSIVKPITKKCLRLENENNVKKYLDILIQEACSDRKGPVWLEVPLDIQNKYINTDHLLDDPLSNIISKLKNSKKPLILAGQGVRNIQDTDILSKTLEKLNIPVILSRMGIDIIPYSASYNLGIGGIKGKLYNNHIMKQSDLIIAIGTSLSPAFVGADMSFLSDNIIIIDIDESELTKFNNVSKNILTLKMDSGEFLSYLYNNLSESDIDISEWNVEVCKFKKLNEIKLKRETPIDIYDLVHIIDLESKEGDMFISDAGSSYYVTQQVLKFNKKNQIDVTSGAWASMGVAIPLAIGATLKNKDTNAIVIVGDGSIETNIQELKTVSYYGLPIKIFVINNGGYISIRDHQDKLFDSRYTETGNAMLNFKKVADAFDLKYIKLEKFEDLQSSIRDILNMSGPILIEVICNDKQKLINPLF